jgi:hypothetical protein
MKRRAMAIAGLLVAAALVAPAGCARSSEVNGGGDRVIGDIPAESKFAKISLGMSQQHVYDLIGYPTDTKIYSTGKMWVPFYFGGDLVRQEALYRGEGRITLTGRGSGRVYRIVYDPTEDGYAD